MCRHAFLPNEIEMETRKYKKNFCKLLNIIIKPLRRSGLMFVTLACLYWINGLLTYIPLPENLAYDFGLHCVESYLLCAILSAIPYAWLRRLFFGMVYALSFAICITESFLYQRFYMYFTPTTFNLVFETNSDEASDFLHLVLSSREFYVVLSYYTLLAITLIAFHIQRKSFREWWQHLRLRTRLRTTGIVAFILLATLLGYAYSYVNERIVIARFLNIEHTYVAERTHLDYFYSPGLRIIWSMKFLQLSRGETLQLIERLQKVEVDSCSYKCPTIVLVWGESYNKHHASLYGYYLPTTPHQDKMAERGEIEVFTDVTTPWNVTSNVFKEVLSTHSADQPGLWSDGVLFPAIFHKAGYKVAFITNQFIQSNNQNSNDFNGNFFLNHPIVQQTCFDYRNPERFERDILLLDQLDQFPKGEHNLIIFHLIGQHLRYSRRFTKSFQAFKESDIQRPDLDKDKRQIIADYANATLYNDELMYKICNRYKKENAVIIYMPDHGEAVYDPGVNLYGRNHYSQLNPTILRGEFEIPFWIWFSPSFRMQHPEVVEAAHQACQKPFHTDNLPHLLQGLAGIQSKYYDPRRDLLHPDYDATLPRIVKQKSNYDEIMKSGK